MIDRFTKQDLLNLVQKQNDPCVSIYLATEKTGREIYKPATQLKKLVETAQQKLSGNWMSEVDAKTFLKPILELTERDDFWQNTDRGLALFLNADRLQKWRVTEPFVEQVLVSRQFFVRPILETAFSVEPFCILALSHHQAEFFDADETQIVRIDIPELSSSVEAAMNVSSVERGSSVHTGSREYRGKQGGVFHGHGGKPDTTLVETKSFYRQVDQAVTRRLGDSRKPMVLAAVASQASIYKDINRYRYLIDDGAIGSPDKLSDQQLLANTLPVLKDHLNKARSSAVASFRNMENTTRTLSEASEIIAAAYLGRVDKLFVHSTASLPGEFNPIDRTISYEASTNDLDLDLVEAAIAQTLLHSGDVFTLTEKEMPADQPMVATLRYQ